MADDDFEIQEPSEYQPGKEEAYSHSKLVMAALKDCKDKRAKEMRDGYKTTKFDKQGNAHMVIIPDSMKEFIESVESLMMIQERDYDTDATENIKQIKLDLAERYSKLVELEEEDWTNMPIQIKQEKLRQGHYFRKGFLSEAMPYTNIYIRYKVDAYTKIVSEVQKLIKRLYDYQEEIYEG